MATPTSVCVSDKVSKASNRAAKKAAEIYTFFNPKLRDISYATGDCIRSMKRLRNRRENGRSTGK